MNTLANLLKTAASEMGAMFGVYVGRLCPMHLGHQTMIEILTNVFPENHAVMIGSCNNPISMRHLFSYEDRGDFVREIFPKARIAPLSDFENNANWFRALDDLITVMGGNPKQTLFIGGSQEDVDFYFEHGRKVHIVNRYDGSTTKVSGSEIRDAMIEKRDLDGMLDQRIIPLVRERFSIRWSEARSR